MKFDLILLAALFFISCNGGRKQPMQQKSNEQNWQIARVVTQVHSYNKSGLLDTTRRTENVYVNGLSGVITHFIITRQYDNKNNLISEKTFLILKNKNELSGEVISKYDAKNRLILRTDKIQNVVDKIFQETYNEKNQKIKEISIYKRLEADPEDWNLDSLLAHHGDKKIPRYDTSTISYQYDVKGNVINKVIKNSDGDIVETSTTLYSGNQKTLKFDLDRKGDTISITKYEINGKGFSTEITHDKINIVYTNLYEGNKLIRSDVVDKRMNSNRKETYKYDSKGNEIEHIWYK